MFGGYFVLKSGGGSGIRTNDTLAGIPIFKSDTLQIIQDYIRIVQGYLVREFSGDYISLVSDSLTYRESMLTKCLLLLDPVTWPPPYYVVGSRAGGNNCLKCQKKYQRQTITATIIIPTIHNHNGRVSGIFGVRRPLGSISLNTSSGVLGPLLSDSTHVKCRNPHLLHRQSSFVLGE